MEETCYYACGYRVRWIILRSAGNRSNSSWGFSSITQRFTFSIKFFSTCLSLLFSFGMSGWSGIVGINMGHYSARGPGHRDLDGAHVQAVFSTTLLSIFFLISIGPKGLRYLSVMQCITRYGVWGRGLGLDRFNYG